MTDKSFEKAVLDFFNITAEERDRRIVECNERLKALNDFQEMQSKNWLKYCDTLRCYEEQEWDALKAKNYNKANSINLEKTQFLKKENEKSNELLAFVKRLATEMGLYSNSLNIWH